MLQSLLQLYAKSFQGLTREIWILSIITFVNRSGTVVFLFLAIYLSEQLGFSKTQIAFIMSFHGIGSVAGGYIGGRLTDSVGYYRVMFWSLTVVGFLYISLFWVSSFWMFCVMGFLTSLVGDAFRPAAMASITIYGGGELQTRSMSLYRLAINIGFAIGVAIAGFLAGIFGYGVLFFVDGGTCIVAAFLFLFFLKEKKESEKEIQKASQKNISQKTPPVLQRSAYRDKWYLGYVFFLFFNALVFIQLFHVFPLFCKEELLMSEEGFGALMSFNGILIALLEMPLIYIIAKKRDQMGYIIWGVVLIGLSFLVFNVIGFTIFAAVVSMILVSVGEMINFPLASSLALSRSNSTNRGQYMGLYSMVFAVGLIIAPLLGFRIAEVYGYAILWNVLGVLAAISTVGLLFLRKKLEIIDN